MNRRSFLKLLGGSGAAAAAAVVAPEATKAFFFAPRGGWQSDVIVNPTLQDAWLLSVKQPLSYIRGIPYYQITSPGVAIIGVKRQDSLWYDRATGVWRNAHEYRTGGYTLKFGGKYFA